MIRRSRILATLFIVCMASVIVLAMRRPFDVHSTVSWLLFAVAAGSLLTMQWLGKTPASPDYDAFVAWQNRLVALDTQFDVEDLYIHDRLNAAEWENVYRERESRPKEQRSLKDALRVTVPKLKA